MKKSIISELMPSRRRRSKSKPKGFGNSKESQEHWDDMAILEYLEKHFEEMRLSLPPDDVDFIWAVIPTLPPEPGEFTGKSIPGYNGFIFWSEEQEEAFEYDSKHKNCFMAPMLRAEEKPGSWRLATQEDFESSEEEEEFFGGKEIGIKDIEALLHESRCPICKLKCVRHWQGGSENRVYFECDNPYCQWSDSAFPGDLERGVYIDLL